MLFLGLLPTLSEITEGMCPNLLTQTDKHAWFKGVLKVQ